MPFTALLPAGGLIGGDAAVTAGFVRQSPHTHPDPHPAAQHPASRGALPGTRVGYRAEEGAEAWHNSVHVAGLVPLSTHCHQPAVYFRPSGSCSSWGGGGGVCGFCPREPSSPVGDGIHWEGVGGGKPHCLPSPETPGTSHFPGQREGSGLGSSHGPAPQAAIPLGGNIPSPEWQRAGGCEMEGTDSIWPGAVGNNRDTQLICFPRPLQPPQNCPPRKKVKIRVEN